MTMPLIVEQPAAAPGGTAEVARRIRNVLAAANIDCNCRGRLDDALDRFTRLETQRATRQLLLQAQHQRQRIASLLELLGEIEELTVNEVDATVFAELAALFEDVASAAGIGAAAMRQFAAAEITG